MNQLRKFKTKLNYDGPSFELNVSSDVFSPVLFNHHGIVNQAICMDHDQVHSLIAVGSSNGIVKVYGQNGVEVLLPKRHQKPIKIIQFIIHSSRLFTIDEDNMLFLWCLKTQSPIRSAKFETKITCVSLPVQFDFCYVGQEDGNVCVLDLETFQMSAYSITPYATIRKNSAVSALSLNPMDDSQLLIGYSEGSIVIWEILGRSVSHEYPSFSKKLFSCAWNPTGLEFIAGYETGELVVYSVKSPEPILRRFVSADSGKRSPIKSIKTSRSGGLCHEVLPCEVLVNGGTLEYEPVGLIVLRGQDFKDRILLPLESKCDDFFFAYAEPFPENKEEPISIATLDSNRIVFHDPTFQGFSSTGLNPGLCDPRVLCISNTNLCNHGILKVLKANESKLEENKLQIANGGEIKFEPSAATTYHVVATGHQEGIVKLYETSDMVFCHICTIRLSKLTANVSFLPVTAISLIQYGSSLLCIAGNSKGHILGIELSSIGIDLKFSHSSHQSSLTSIVLVFDHYIVSGDSHSNIVIYGLKERKILTEIKLSEDKSEITCITSFMFPSSKNNNSGAMRIYCGLKNGKVYVIDLVTRSIVTSFIAKKPSPVIGVEAFDSDWQRLGEEKSTQNSEQMSPLLVVSANHIRVYSLADNVYLSKVTVEQGEIQGAYLKEIGGGFFLVAFVNNEQEKDLIIIYTLPDFKIVCKETLEFKVKKAKHSQVPSSNSVMMITSDCEIIKMLLLKGSDPSGRTAIIDLIDPNIKPPVRKSKTLMGSVNSVGALVGESVVASVGSIRNKLKNTASKTSLKRVFSLKSKGNKEEQEEDDTPTSPTSPTVSTATPSSHTMSLFKSHSSEIEFLFGKNEIKRDANRQLLVSDDPFSNLKRGLNERGEKLTLLSDKTTAMVDSAKKMYDSTKKT